MTNDEFDEVADLIGDRPMYSQRMWLRAIANGLIPNPRAIARLIDHGWVEDDPASVNLHLTDAGRTAIGLRTGGDQ